MKVFVVTYNIDNGYCGPEVYKTKEAALRDVKGSLLGDLSRRQLETLEDNLFLEWGSAFCPNTVSIEEREVQE